MSLAKEGSTRPGGSLLAAVAVVLSGWVGGCSEATPEDRSEGTADRSALEARVVARATERIASYGWPPSYRPTGRTMWNAVFEPAASDVDLDAALVSGVVDFWNLCAWALEGRDRLTAGSGAGVDDVLVAIDAYAGQHHGAGEADDQGSDLAGRVRQSIQLNDLSTLQRFIAANTCEPFPS